MTDTAIELTGLTKRFGSFTAVDDLSLQVNRGEIFGLLGPNGSGKTTTINMISGLSRPTSGSITVLGIDVLAEPRRIRRSLGTVPQENALYEELTAEANLRFHADLFDVPRHGLDEKITNLIELAQLQERRRSRVSTFSGGMKRRLALVRAMLHEPELLYFDEPTLGVDVQSRHALWDRILELKRRGTTFAARCQLRSRGFTRATLTAPSWSVSPNLI
jgi:ABC-type multidrug transport system ATPase subunit